MNSLFLLVISIVFVIEVLVRGKLPIISSGLVVAFGVFLVVT